MSKNYFIFDTNKCVGCDACIVACINENGFQQPDTWRNVHTSYDSERPGTPLFHISLACNHCDDAPCMASCPALAYNRSGITGAVLHDAGRCIGCQYCTWTCPYEAPKYLPSKGVVEKCDFCESRLIRNEKPACVSMCPTAALEFSFEEIAEAENGTSLPVQNDPKPSLIIKPLKKKKGPEVDPNLYLPWKTYLPLKASNELIELGEKEVDLSNKINGRSLDKNTLDNDWPLLLFTLISAMMVGITSTGFFHDLNIFEKLLFPIIGLISTGISLMHLGVKCKAWRAILNLKGSWVSREILLFSLFYVVGTLGLFVIELPLSITMLVGIFFLYTIDMLYWPVQPKQRNHSAQALLIGLSTYLLFNDHLQLLAFIIAIRLFIFLRGRSKPFSAKNLFRIVSSVMTVILLYWDINLWIVFCVFIIGELIDRMNFYYDLEKPDVSRLLKHATHTGSN
jgi:Fe-S-cluster-containing dehydrogenase component/DMSO reductase anchor subunit